MGFFDWFSQPLQNQYADFAGRATRQAYWMFVLVSIIISLGISLVEAVVIGTTLVSTLFSLAILVPSVAIAARRLHDIGMSGWWQLIVLIPFVGIIVLIVLLAKQGEEGNNKYGPSTIRPLVEPGSDIPPAPLPTVPLPPSRQDSD